MAHFMRHGALFWLLFWIWLVLEIAFAARARRLRTNGTRRTYRDRGSAAAIVLGMYVLLAITFWFASNRFGFLPVWTRWVGLVLMASGIVIRFSAIRQLGRFFSPLVNVAEDQQIIQTGWYRHIRHPAYTGGWITAVGIALSLRTWWGAVLCGVGLFLLYLYRIHVEEQALVDHFGEPYRSYMKRTKRMFPGVW
ncbi:isoprenylcysteine carboxylmethyltransferase family protein [Alicyclobacillus cycloheptanicus]|uniref:Protein-S-isoprenylcysteine O-methyltransferase Ste14 n=1 Tax=Alicyclobacillus cycloheptanicus TaxID=1457 RepID=A0ABT9XNF4_9BACL|nr:isoprenylcysteine carboxylmethyltransferase family protein [Alicyclobacillus cycloheptanicus]MDQ0191268.1 protein-S-isoprenylcysteine O-methyltransferase Ste14 [Alicyclobacillus cycloheptanicus]WDM00456.1 isoprenylcysteine carboxylmethyltransferase family protein [Alicyclobacillus cycloheptanicus]